MSDNIEHPAGKRPCLQTDLSKLWYASALSADRLHTVPGWALRPASTIADSILDTAGALPARRNPIDARIVSGIRDGSGHMIKDQASVGGYPALPSTQNPVALPITSRTIQNDQMRSAVEQWLCNLSRAAGASDDPIRDRLSACPLGH